MNRDKHNNNEANTRCWLGRRKRWRLSYGRTKNNYWRQRVSYRSGTLRVRLGSRTMRH